MIEILIEIYCHKNIHIVVTNLQKVHCQFSLEALTHLNKSMIWFIVEEFDSYDISIEGE